MTNIIDYYDFYRNSMLEVFSWAPLGFISWLTFLSNLYIQNTNVSKLD